MRSSVERARARWELVLYPDAREAGGSFTSALEHVWVPAGAASNPTRAAEEAARRARGKVRRYAAANRLNRFGTLTYGPPRETDPARVRKHVGLFFRGLREGLGGRALPYVWVPELHKDGVHFHLHYAVNRFVSRGVIGSAWTRGIYDIRLISDLPVGSGVVEEARVAARYLSKYVSKAFTDPTARPPGMHRYDVARGFQPSTRLLTGRTREEVLDQACAALRSEPSRVWLSDEHEGWGGPPAVWAQWPG